MLYFQMMRRIYRISTTSNSSIEDTWMVAPLAYQKGPLTPYSQATLELCKIVAAHVHYTHTHTQKKKKMKILSPHENFKSIEYQVHLNVLRTWKLPEIQPH
jgi:hypothetical protein